MKKKIIPFLLLTLFICTAFFLSERGKTEAKGNSRLGNNFQSIQGWETVENYQLLDVIYNELNLDDYLHRKYASNTGEVTLYIGYYNSSKKVGAAHDPMVCFPGQGWSIEDPNSGVYKGFSQERYGAVRYSTMLALKGENPLVLLYWFQAYDEAVSSTFIQKLKLAGKTLTGKGESNAFVRLSTPCSSRKYDKCQEVLLEFVHDFYPRFFDYVVQDGRTDHSQ